MTYTKIKQGDISMEKIWIIRDLLEDIKKNYILKDMMLKIELEQLQAEKTMLEAERELVKSGKKLEDNNERLNEIAHKVESILKSINGDLLQKQQYLKLQAEKLELEHEVKLISTGEKLKEIEKRLENIESEIDRVTKNIKPCEQSYIKQLQTYITNEFESGKDYTDEGPGRGRGFKFTHEQARRILDTSTSINNYFLNKMIKAKYDDETKDIFKKYFYEETERFNKEFTERYAQFTYEEIERHNKESTENYVQFAEDSINISDGAYIDDSKNDYQHNETENSNKDKFLNFFTGEGAIEKFIMEKLFDNSLFKLLDYFGIDVDAYKEAYNAACKLISCDLGNVVMEANPYDHPDESADYPYNEEVSYLYYILSRPLIYFRKGNKYLSYYENERLKKNKIKKQN